MQRPPLHPANASSKQGVCSTPANQQAVEPATAAPGSATIDPDVTNTATTAAAAEDNALHPTCNQTEQRGKAQQVAADGSASAEEAEAQLQQQVMKYRRDVRLDPELAPAHLK